MCRVLHLIPSMEQGGAERILASLVAGSCSDETGRRNDTPEKEPAEVQHAVVTLLAGEPFFPLPAGRMATLGLSKGSLGLWELASLPRLRRLIRERKPSVIQAWLYHGNFASIAAAGLGTPIIWSIHNTTLSANQSKRMTRTINRVSAVLSHSIPARIVYPAPHARALHEGLGYARERGVVIANGIDLPAFRFDAGSRTKVRAELGINDGEFAVGCVARFDPQKNHPLLIEAFAHLPPHLPGKLVLVGRDCTAGNEKLRGWLMRAGAAERTLLLGERTDVPAIMSAIDALVIASSYGEAAPVVAIEAAASGLPLISTDAGLGGDEASEAATALVLCPSHIVPKDDAWKMAQALLHVHARFTGPCRSQRAASRSALLAHYSFERMRAEYDTLYRSVAGRT